MVSHNDSSATAGVQQPNAEGSSPELADLLQLPRSSSGTGIDHLVACADPALIQLVQGEFLLNFKKYFWDQQGAAKQLTAHETVQAIKGLEQILSRFTVTYNNIVDCRYADCTHHNESQGECSGARAVHELTVVLAVH